jgi:regulator of protease activity HflC (stomatin/prohibitin superfamily)
MQVLLGAGVLIAAYVLASIKVLNQYERAVIFFLGKHTGTKGPGLIVVPALLARMKRVSMRVVVMDVPAQDVITRDNISVKVNAVLYFRVTGPSLAVIEVQDYLHATAQLAQTTLLSVLGQVELDELLADRRKVNDILKQLIDERTDFWGIEVSAVEIKDVLLPDSMRRAIGRQAEAERERRAKVISAQGELQASETLAQAARMLSSQPASLQLRYLQTTIFPLPIDLISAFMQRADNSIAAPTPAGAGLPPVTGPSALAAGLAQGLPQITIEPQRKGE